MKTRSYLIFVTLLLLCFANANAHDFEVDGIYYNITSSSNKTVDVTYRGTSYYSNEYTGSVVIPSSVTYNGTTYSVTSIGNDALNDCSGLTSVTIPNSVTSIGSLAFYGCSGLTSITIGNSVTNIGESAFSGCTGLTSVTIPNSVTSIGDHAFSNCSRLTNVTIGNSVTSIGSGAFSSCTGLTSVTIPNSVTSIGRDAFRFCSGLTSVTIPNGVTSIGSDAFYGCRSLTSVHISDLSAWCNIEFDDYDANPLYYAKNLYLNGELLTDLVIPDGVTKIKGWAFYYYTGLTSVTIPNSVTSIGESAFKYCDGLTSVTIPNSVTSIGNEAFYDCSGLTSITIPNSVTSIGEGAFYYCRGLTSVHISDLSAWCNIEFGSNDANPLLHAKTKNLYLNGELLTNLIIPDGVTKIKSWVFYNCSGLTSVTIPNSVTSIEDYAFYDCSGLKEIYVKATTPPTAGYYMFTNIYTTATLYVPVGSKDAYAAANGWSEFYNIVEMEFTGIDEVVDEVKGENSKVKDVYDLSGRKVTNPTKGIYIVNGKKVLLK